MTGPDCAPDPATRLGPHNPPTSPDPAARRRQTGWALALLGAVLVFAAYLIHQHDISHVNHANEYGNAIVAFGGYYQDETVNNNFPIGLAIAGGVAVLFGGLTVISVPPKPAD